MELQIVIGAGKTATVLAAWDWPWKMEDISSEDFPNIPVGARVRWAMARKDN